MGSKINMIAGLYEAFGFEQLSITDSVKSLTKTEYTKSTGELAIRTIITVEDAQIRYRYDGTNPSATVGHTLNPNDVLVLIGSGNIQNFKAIRTGSSNGKINCSYEE